MSDKLNTASEKALTAALDQIRIKTDMVPEIGIVLGSGMGDLIDMLEDRISIPYEEIPSFPRATAPSHRGQLHFGRIKEANCVIMQGRLHLYEGHSPQDVAFPIRLLHLLGTGILVATNAAGGVNKSYAVGDLVLVEDHIDIAGIAGMDPTRGANLDTLGPRFTPLNRAYHPEYLDLMESIAAELQINTHRGVYGFATGPSFETPAEIRFLSIIGVDAVGMSTVPEVIAARHCGMRVVVVSAITNVCIHDTASQQDTTEDEVYENAALLLKNVNRLLEHFVSRLPDTKQ
ncbi:MAG: purine-nucleoside phosphorylase [Woeseiaceae bacterium]